MATMVLPQFPWYPVSGSAGNKKKGKKMSAQDRLTSYVLVMPIYSLVKP